jgi:hypothetical protein
MFALMSDFTAILVILAVIVGLPCVVAFFFGNYVSPAERKRQAEWQELRKSDPNAPMPPEPELPVWVKLLGGAVVIFYLGGLIIVYAIGFFTDTRVAFTVVCLAIAGWYWWAHRNKPQA